jgi:cytochrome c
MPTPRSCRALSQHAPLPIASGALFAGLLLLGSTVVLAAEGGDPQNGARAFRACVVCHSLAPGQHRTGPSLAGVFGRKAGTAEGFRRYSPALKAADVVWDRTTLDDWLTDPQAFIPGNRMIFPGIKDEQARADLIAYLVQAEHQTTADASQGGGMMGGMGGGDLPDLKTLGPEHQVTAIHYCGDTYAVATADGGNEPYWEMNLRFKTDGGDRGPRPGKPVIVGAGMMGDRASVIFAAPAEISSFIQSAC